MTEEKRQETLEVIRNLFIKECERRLEDGIDEQELAFLEIDAIEWTEPRYYHQN